MQKFLSLQSKEACKEALVHPIEDTFRLIIFGQVIIQRLCQLQVHFPRPSLFTLGTGSFHIRWSTNEISFVNPVIIFKVLVDVHMSCLEPSESMSWGSEEKTRIDTNSSIPRDVVALMRSPYVVIKTGLYCLDSLLGEDEEVVPKPQQEGVSRRKAKLDALIWKDWVNFGSGSSIIPMPDNVLYNQ